MKKKIRIVISLAVLIVLGVVSVFAYFKIIDHREQIICYTEDRNVNLNFGKIENVYCRYHDKTTTFIYFKTKEDRQKFVDRLVESEYFDKIYWETDYRLIKGGYIFSFNTWYNDFITCDTYKKS